MVRYQTDQTIRTVWHLALALLAGVAACAAPAMAMQSCEGTVAATPLHPLPETIVVGLDLRDASPRALQLAEKFKAGLKLANVATGPEANVLLYVAGSSLGDGGGRGGMSERSYSGMSVFQGGMDPGSPQMPAGRLRGAKTRPSLPTLFIRAEATVVGTKRVAWVASIQCQQTGPDEDRLAVDLGRVIGGVLGKQVTNGRL